MRYSLTFLLFLTALSLISQNKTDYFKVWIKGEQTGVPAWATLMYSEDPNVFEVDQQFNLEYLDEKPLKTIHLQNYKHWRKLVQPHIDEDGYIRPQTKAERRAFEASLKERKAKLKRLAPSNTWTSIGPFETYADGSLTPVSQHANVYSIDVSKNNSNKVVCGTEAGGVFLSNDKGANWTLITKDEVFANGITAVSFYPNDDTRILAGANDRIYQTTNNGGSWTELLDVSGSIFEFKFNPTNNTIFALGSSGLFKSTNGGGTWNQIYNASCWDLDFHPSNSNIVYLLKSNSALKKTEFLRSTDAGNTFNVISAGWYVPENQAQASDQGGKIAVSAQLPNRVYVALIGASKIDDNGWIGLYRSDDSGQNWYLPANQIGGPYNNPNNMPWNPAAYSDGYHQGFYNFDLEASQNNADVLWMGSVRLTESADGGATYKSIGAANSTRLSNVHADVQGIHINGNDIWIVSDGGVNLSTDECQTHIARNRGIIASDFWGFGSGWNEDVLVGGKYHNGNTAYYQTYGVGETHNIGGVEESTGYVNPLTNRKAYFSQWWSNETISKRVAIALGQASSVQPSVSLIPNESYVVCSSSGLYFDPRYADHIYMGTGSEVVKSIDGGLNFSTLHDFGSNGKVMEMAICMSNPDVIYAVFQPNGGHWDICEIHRSADGGNSWSKLNNIVTNRWRLDLSVNPLDEDEVWVTAANGSNGNKVYQTLDGGQNWTNRTSALLNGESTRDILYQAGSDHIYLASTSGLFYFDKNSGQWTDYSQGLPMIVSSLEMQPFYKEGKLRLATYGRGIWEVDFAAPSNVIAQAMTKSKDIFCSRDLVQLESYSVVDQSNVTWNWNITPAPLSISNPNIRNPEVVFGESGTFSVSLTVTGPNGSDVYTQSDFIVVDAQCDPETFAGGTLKVANDGDWLQTPDLNLSAVTEFTMSAWIKPNGIQNQYASIIMNDDDSAGLNFRENNNTLGYHWPGGSWSWDSNLLVDQNEWSHVALVAQPGSITLYVNGIPAIHNTNINPVDLNTFKIGSYKGWGGRNVDGEIDEVVLWNRALTTHEIRLHRHLTKENLIQNQDGIVAYYQFNEDVDIVLDRASSNHSSLVGNASKVRSSAPVGGGDSAVKLVNTNQTYTFNSTGVSMDFSGSTALPNGNLYVSRIDNLPFNTLADLEYINSYWVVNNYGNQAADSPNNILVNSPHSDPSVTALDNIALIELVNRKENEFRSSWARACSSQSITGGPNGNYSFTDAACLHGLDYQFTVSQVSCPQNIQIVTDYTAAQTETVIANQTITANSAILPANQVTHQAGLQISLLSGFETEIGAFFHAYIEDCTRN